MKSCAYCGRENEDAVIVCAECGTSEFNVATTTSPPPTEAGDQEEREVRLQDILTDPVRLFRALVIVATTSYLIWFFHLILGGRLISPGVWDALSWQGYGALLPLPQRIGWLFMLISVALAVGLYGFSKSARLVFTLFMAFSLVSTPLEGVHVGTAFGSFLGLIIHLADGAILLMAYTPPLKDRFV